MFGLPLAKHPQSSREPFSRQTLAKTSRLCGASVTESVCPYCAVGCGQLIYTKAGKVIDIEGNPDSPHQRGYALSQRGRHWLLEFWQVLTGMWLMHLTYGTVFNIALGRHWWAEATAWASSQWESMT
jgi:formate dehydrogenase major subunit